MKPPRSRIRTLMLVVAGSAIVAWVAVISPRLGHFWTSIALGLALGALLGSACLIASVATARVALFLDERRCRRLVASIPFVPEDSP